MKHNSIDVGSGLSRTPFKTLEFKADWQRHGKDAFHQRNIQMVRYAIAMAERSNVPVLCIIFPGRRGTEDLVRCVKNGGIPIVLAEYEEVGQGDGGKDLAATGGLRAGSIPASRRPARRGGAIIRAPQVPEVGEGQNGRKDKRAATGR